MKYIINLIVVFIPKEKTLALYNEPLNMVTLSNPACRLLLELIKNNGNVSSREDLQQKVWLDYGFRGSNNNLNSYISEIRKHLTSLSADLTIITTIPKVGFQLDANIQVSLQEPLNENDDTTAADFSLNNQHENYLAENNFHEIKNDAMSMMEVQHTVNAKKNNVIFFLLAFILISLFIFLQSKKTINFFQESYTYLFTVDKCNVFSLTPGNVYPDEFLKEMFMQDIKSEKINCDNIEKDIFYKKSMPDNTIANISVISVCSIIKSGKYNHCLTINKSDIPL